MRRLLIRGLIGILLVVGLAALAWTMFGLAFVEARIKAAMARQGVTVTALNLQSLGTDRAVLADISLDYSGRIAIGRVEIDYRLGRLLAERRVDRVVVSKASIDLGWPPAGQERGEAPGTVSTSSVGPVASAIDLPVDQILVQESVVALTTPVGALYGSFGLEVNSSPEDGIAVGAMAMIRGDSGGIAIPIVATVTPQGAFELTATPEAGRLNWRETTLTIDGGTLTVLGTLAGPEQVDAVLAGGLTGPDGLSARLDIQARLDGDRADLGLTIDGGADQGRVAVTAALEDWTGDTPAFDVGVDSGMPLLSRIASLAGLETGAASEGELSATATGRWDRAQDDGTLIADPMTAEIAVSGILPDGVAIDGGYAVLDGRLAVQDGEMRFDAETCQPVTAGRIAVAGALSVPDGVSACLMALPDRPMLILGPNGVTTEFRLRTTEMADVRLVAEAADLVRVVVAPLQATVSLAAGVTGQALKVTTDDAALQMPDYGVAMGGIDLAADFAGGAEPELRAQLIAGTLLSLEGPALFVPVHLTGDVRRSTTEVLDFQGSALAASGGLTAAFEGRHDLADGTGSAEFRLDPISFAPGVRQPVDLAPALASTPIADVTGTIDGQGRIGWGRRLTSSGEFRLDDVTLALFGVVVRTVDGTLRADSLIPLNLPDGQLLSLGGADVGIALDEGAVAFGIADGDLLSVQGVGLGFAGGSLAVEPFQTRMGDLERSLVVAMQGVDLAELSEQLAVEGLALTGTLGGRVPVRLIDDTISLENGILETSEGGVIRYVPTVPFGPSGEGGIALLLNAVQNFQYDGLRATVNGKTGEDLDVAIRLSGANPDLYDGFPIALNVNLSGALDQILRSGLRSLSIADQTEDLLRRE